MRKTMKALTLSAALLGLSVTGTAAAMEQGDILIRFGGSYVDPKSNNHEVVSVDSASSITFNFSYMLTQNWAVELLAAYPFSHDIRLNDGGAKVADTKHLPPTVTLQYHFMPTSTFQPYVGLGLNYTRFFDTDTVGPLNGLKLNLGDSWGLAGELGADIMLNDRWFLNFSARYVDISTKAKLAGDSLGSVDISPWVYSANAGLRF